MSQIDIEKADTGSSCKENPHKADVILVKVVTTSGTFPRNDFEREKATDIIGKFLKKAEHSLQLTDVAGWIAAVDSKKIDPTTSYSENNLTGTVTIQWGPREGGGGY